MASLQKVYNIKENLRKIDISCEQITFNPVDETINIISCELKNNLCKNRSTSISYISKPMKQPAVHNGDLIEENDRYDYCATPDAVVDTICLGAIFLLILLWMGVYTFVTIKEAEYINSFNNTSMDTEFIDEDSVINWSKN